jgi:hypothetical protein
VFSLCARGSWNLQPWQPADERLSRNAATNGLASRVWIRLSTSVKARVEMTAHPSGARLKTVQESDDATRARG